MTTEMMRMCVHFTVQNRMEKDTYNSERRFVNWTRMSSKISAVTQRVAHTTPVKP